MKEANTLADELLGELDNFDEVLRNELSSLLIKYINRRRD
jgi:farnesyl diphosphate synthase